jgi:hypothetical protein
MSTLKYKDKDGKIQIVENISMSTQVSDKNGKEIFEGNFIVGVAGKSKKYGIAEVVVRICSNSQWNDPIEVYCKTVTETGSVDFAECIAFDSFSEAKKAQDRLNENPRARSTLVKNKMRESFGT